MELQLRGKRAFVSGSTQGIGYAIARSLAREGVEVVINGRSQARVDDAVRALRAELPSTTVSGIAADLSVPAQVELLVAALGRVDILVNNVGLFEVKSFLELTDEDWMRFFQANVMTAVRLSRAILPQLIEAGWGRVIFIGSESGVNIPADMTHYGVTKAGMLALGNGLAKLTRGTGVTVNTILGGPTYSDGVAQTVQQIASAQRLPPEVMKAAIIGENRTTLLERFLEPGEIASLVTYLASPLSSATNGAALRADGGVLTAML